MSGNASSQVRSARSGGGSVRSVNYATSPLLASKTPPWRSRLVVLAVGLAFAGLIARAAYLQVIATDFYQAEGEKRFMHRELLSASRGRVLDRHGQVLATSVAMPTVQVETRLFNGDAAQRRALAGLLGMSPAELDERLDGPAGTVVLRRHVDEAVWQQVKALGLRGVQELREYQRRYPEGEAAAHVVGFTDIDGRGLEGIELGFHSQLSGQAGLRTVVRDRLGRVVEDVGETEWPVHGRDVLLSIDSKIQFFAWQRLRDAVREHGARSGSAVVLDAQTGEVLALANYPSYDPARRRGAPGGAMRNRALTDVFEPGSTVKPFVVAQALESGRVQPQTPIDTAPGRITITGSTISDAHAYGMLSVAQVVQKSSNVGTVKLAMEMPAREMWEMYAGIGLGARPEIDFPGAVTGRLRPHRSWRPIEKATMSYGYGLSASLLQLARAYTVFTHDGELLPLTILRRDDAAAPVSGPRVFSKGTAELMRGMLQAAAGPGGTAPRAQALGYSVGGKTGTARKQEGRGYTNKYRAWFVGFAPVQQPRIVVAVMVDEPSKGVYYGGAVAAPVFSQVVQQALRTLNVPPDLDVQAQIKGPAPVAEPESI